MLQYYCKCSSITHQIMKRKDGFLKKALSFVLLFSLLACALAFSVNATGQSVGVFIDNSQFNGNVTIKDNTTFVGVRKFATSMDSSAKVTYNYSTRTLNYVVANGRYLYTPTPIYMRYGIMYAPVLIMAKAFDAKISWSNYNSSFYITRGSGGILSGDKFYRSDEVYWLSRIINAESGGEILKGKIAVGNVILNRVRSSYFPNTIYGVIFDKKNGTQFSPTANGMIYKAPNTQSIIAAKICLEGYSINTGILYFVNPSIVPHCWVCQNRRLYAQIGNHAFYY